jgi:tetratricopeptide (TPR) repeat protein
MKKLGRLDVGSDVEASREDDDGLEPCKIKAIDTSSAKVDLAFPDGFVRKGVDVSAIKMETPEADGDGTDATAPVQVMPEVAPPAREVGEEEEAYLAEVGPQLPPPPPPASLEADSEVKYAYIKAYKDVGNGLFKAAKYAWAIRTYCEAVDALAKHCYESRERMLWDYFARVPCGQCYSNAALCALKQGEHAHAARLCGIAMQCKPEDTDLVKVLLRHGQALLGLGHGEEAKAVLERAADKEPSNRAVREELVKAKKAVAAAEKAAGARLFASVDLSKKGLTSKKEVEVERIKGAIDKGFAALVEHNDSEALKQLGPLIEGKGAEASHRKPTTVLAAYGVGVCRYHLKQMDEAIAALGLFFSLKAECAVYAPPPPIRAPTAHSRYPPPAPFSLPTACPAVTLHPLVARRAGSTPRASNTRFRSLDCRLRAFTSRTRSSRRSGLPRQKCT